MKGFAFALSAPMEAMNEDQCQLMFADRPRYRQDGQHHPAPGRCGADRGSHLDLFPQRVNVPELVAALKESLDRDRASRRDVGRRARC